MCSLVRRARIRQIQVCSRWLGKLSSSAQVFALIKSVRDLPILRRAFIFLTGYNRPFLTLGAAEREINEYQGDGHTSLAHANVLMRESTSAALSDYAALFFLQSMVPCLIRVFDFGGNVGNLFHCYAGYLAFRPDLTWTVYDLPANLERGKQIAGSRQESRLRFTHSLSDAENSDLLLASGSLHYFERSLPEIIKNFNKKPRFVLINRTPLVNCRPFATVQDAGTFRVACMLHNEEELIKGFRAAGYQLKERWTVEGKALTIPLYPDRPVTYCGMFLRLDDEPFRFEAAQTD